MSFAAPSVRDYSREPVVVGATGGSGTRVLVRLLLRADVFMGANRNPAEDSRDFVELHDRWINSVVAGPQALRVEDWKAFDGEFRACVARLRSALADTRGRWGWKEPRAVFLLPFLHRHYPEMRFIHVVRDGRDMALSKNQNQLRKHGDAFLGVAERAMSARLRSILLWSRNNVAAADYGETHMPGAYLRVRFEDLCADPLDVTRRIYAFLGLEYNPDLVSAASAEVQAPSSLGRGLREGREELSRLPEEVVSALRRFGFSS